MHNQEERSQNTKPVKKDSARTLAEVIVGILNIVFAYGFISFFICIAAFSWFPSGGPAYVPEKRPTWVLAMLPFFCFGLIMISCAITDFVMMIKLKRNPYDEKSRNIRRKGGKILLISFIILIYLSVIEFIINLK